MLSILDVACRTWPRNSKLLPWMYIFFIQGLGKRKNRNSQHYQNTRDLLMWSEGNEPLVSTYRSQYLFTPGPSKDPCNDVEPLHIRNNLGVQRRQLRVRSTPPRSQTAPLLTWNATDEFLHVKPLVGSQTNRFADHVASQKARLGRASQRQMSSSTTLNPIVSETITPLNMTV